MGEAGRGGCRRWAGGSFLSRRYRNLLGEITKTGQLFAIFPSRVEMDQVVDNTLIDVQNCWYLKVASPIPGPLTEAGSAALAHGIAATEALVYLLS